jgi:ankyrin repeat protein
LFIACRLGHEKMIMRLLELGANPNTKDFLGRTCEDIARRKGKPRVVQLINVWKMSNY